MGLVSNRQTSLKPQDIYVLLALMIRDSDHTRFGFIASPLHEQQLLLLLKDARAWVK